MGRRQFPWDLREVPWSQDREFTRGLWEGKPLLSYGIAPRDKLATRRQLRAMDRRPGGADPAAVLYFRNRVAGKLVFADLFQIAEAKPVRPMTPAKQAAVEKALTARRTCGQCGEDTGVYLPRANRRCEPCRYTLGDLEPDDYLHDYLTGEPVPDQADRVAVEQQGPEVPSQAAAPEVDVLEAAERTDRALASAQAAVDRIGQELAADGLTEPAIAPAEPVIEAAEERAVAR
jgi:hypothetical protein